MLEYTLISDSTYAVVMLEGSLTGSCAGVLRRCASELKDDRPQVVVMNLGPVVDLDEAGIHALMELQAFCRTFARQLKLCQVSSWHRPALEKLGALLPEEYAPDLVSAIDDSAGLDLD